MRPIFNGKARIMISLGEISMALKITQWLGVTKQKSSFGIQYRQ